LRHDSGIDLWMRVFTFATVSSRYGANLASGAMLKLFGRRGYNPPEEPKHTRRDLQKETP
jgi:hypothetical protein